MLILRGVPDEIEGGWAPPSAPGVDVDGAVTGWVATARPETPGGPYEPTLGTKLQAALRALGAHGWMHEIPGSAIGLDDEAVLWFSAYGADADAMLACLRAPLSGCPIRPGSFAVLYRGHGPKERRFLDAV